MTRKNEIRRQFDEMEKATTSRTEMGFQFTINRQLERIAIVKSMITPSDHDQDFIENVLSLVSVIDVLEDLLANEVENDNNYKKVLNEIAEINSKTIGLNDFIVATYNTNLDRRDARDTGRGRIGHNRYRAERQMKIETMRWRGLIMLMKRHNLLLKRKEWEDEM